jgi:small-conductance mechanosensitive channel
MWRLRLRVWGGKLLGALIGAVAGSVMLSAIYGRPAWPAVVLAGIVGIVIAHALQTGGG